MQSTMHGQICILMKIEVAKHYQSGSISKICIRIVKKFSSCPNLKLSSCPNLKVKMKIRTSFGPFI